MLLMLCFISLHTEEGAFLRNCRLYCLHKAGSAYSNMSTRKGLHRSFIYGTNNTLLFWARWGLKLNIIEFVN